MNYDTALEYLYAHAPMFQQVGAQAYKANLNNIIQLCEHLGNPQEKIKTVHIAGTNGKGSTAHSIAAVLQTAGYKTGLYTSPHLKNFTERIRINGEEVEQQYVADFVRQAQTFISTIQPSFFEITTAMAFDYFAKQRVDIAIIEVGMGGRLDATNLINPLLSVITNISYDHQAFLGDTLEKIAAEKAGIIKPHTPVIISETQPNLINVFVEKAQAQQAPIAFAEKDWRVIPQDNQLLDIWYKKQPLYHNVALDLQGQHQIKNLYGILEAIHLLQNNGFVFSEAQLKTALASVSTITHLRGRWETLSTSPLIIADTAHNEAGIFEVMAKAQRTPHQNLYIVFGTMKDKDLSKVLPLLPSHARYYFCAPTLPRALPAEELATKAQNAGLQGEICNSVLEAVEKAKTKAKTDDLVLITGSNFVVAEVLL